MCVCVCRRQTFVDTVKKLMRKYFMMLVCRMIILRSVVLVSINIFDPECKLRNGDRSEYFLLFVNVLVIF